VFFSNQKSMAFCKLGLKYVQVVDQLEHVGDLLRTEDFAKGIRPGAVSDGLDFGEFFFSYLADLNHLRFLICDLRPENELLRRKSSGYLHSIFQSYNFSILKFQ